VTRTADKHLRAAAAQPFVEQGKLLFPQNHDGQVHADFRSTLDEMLAFPAGSHDDTVDCVVDLCTAASSGTVVTSGGAVTVATDTSRMFDSRAVKRRMFG
jgi:phage terminase large subunit-like protein